VQVLKPSLHLEGERALDELVALKWDRKNGFNDRMYYVERSLDDTNHFETVNLVWAKARQKTHEKYRLGDDNDYNEVSYYRLRLIENNSKFVYSNIIKVNGYSIEKLTMYPNPASNMVTLTLMTKVEGVANIIIYDANGRFLQQQRQLMQRGSNIQNLYVSNLLSGTYLVEVVMADKTTRKGKIIKATQ